MDSEIIAAALHGAKVTIEADCWPLRRKAGGIVVRMMKQTWNGVVNMSRTVKIDEPTGGEPLEEAVNRTAREMAEEIGN